MAKLNESATARANARSARFDAFELASGGGVLDGTVGVRSLPRAADRLASSDPSGGNDAGGSAGGTAGGTIAWQIRGGHDAQRRPSLTVKLEGSATLTCQRCLQSVDQPIDQITELLLARDERDLARLDAEDAEVVLADSPLDPLTLVEDELLLSLPFAPRHADDACAIKGLASAPETKAASPFSQLARLKQSR